MLAPPPPTRERIRLTAGDAGEFALPRREQRLERHSASARPGPEPVPDLDVEVACHAEWHSGVLTAQSSPLGGLRGERLAERCASAHWASPGVAPPGQHGSDDKVRSTAVLDAQRRHAFALDCQSDFVRLQVRTHPDCDPALTLIRTEGRLGDRGPHVVRAGGEFSVSLGQHPHMRIDRAHRFE